MTHTQPQGFLALPSTGKGRGVLVLHPWWGLNDTIRSFCTRLSEAGFTAFAPDLYHGKLARTIPEAEILSQALDEKIARSDVTDAAVFLSQRAAQGAQGIAVIGFSLGVWFALELSVTHPMLIQAVVVFYGTRPGDYSASRAAYQGHFAEADPYEAEAEVNNLENSLHATGRPVTFHRYPATGHWFFEPDRTEAYNHSAATLAWDRTLAFLRDSLPSDAS